jgi:ATP-dependent Clp endopeptidase proteolytic subunit ClpP
MSKFDNYFEEIRVTDFNSEDVAKFRRQVIEESCSDNTAPIHIYIDSDGGDVDGLAAMVETLGQVPNKIVTICIGRACSAGAFLLSFGDERYCGDSSTVMIHKLASGAFGHIEDINGRARELNRINNMWISKLANNCGKEAKEIDRLLRTVEGRDHFMDAEQAKKFGIVDYIGIPPFLYKKKNGVKRKKNGKTKKTSKRRNTRK